MDALATVEEELAALARRGGVAPLSDPFQVNIALPRLQACASTRPLLGWGEKPLRNTDNVLLEATSVAGEAALVLALAHGNYKDGGCAYAAAAAVCAIHEELAKPHLAPADVPPALRRALISANDRVGELAKTTVHGRGIGTVMGIRTDLRGIGASVTAAVVTHRETVIVHVGENRALLLRDGRLRDLVVPHTLWYSCRSEDRARMRESDAEFTKNIVVQVVGMSDTICTQVFRVPTARGDRLVLGNGGLRAVLEASNVEWSSPLETLCREVLASSATGAPWVPPSIIIVDLQ